MIHIIDKAKCCGCSACAQRCPKQCITMQEDEEGFLYPKVDETLCVDCGLCEKVCPIIHQNEPKQPLKVYAAKNKNENQRLRSSSGGIFILLAELTIKKGGVVFGARFDKNWEVEHGFAETLEDLAPLMRSKYVQSRIGTAYKDTERFLKEGRRVLFVGTPCQIAGLKRYLKKEYESLLAVDIICHGVPSPSVWRNYLNEICNKSQISSINFREKQLGGYSWKKYGVVVNNATSDNKALMSSYFKENPFMKAFLHNLILRPSCYACPAKDGKSQSDITIADFWGIQNLLPEFDDDKGVGLIISHNQEGLATIESLDINKIETNLDDVVRCNISYQQSVAIPRGRSKFWRCYRKGNSIDKSIHIAEHQSFLMRVLRWGYRQFANNK